MLELANKVLIRLKSLKSLKYLRCNKKGNVDATAGKQPDAVFIVHRINANELKLQSAENLNQWLFCDKEGNVSDKGQGGEGCTFMVKYHERGTLSLSPKHNIDWHVGVDEYGRIQNATKVKHEIGSSFEVELVDA